MNKEEIYGDIVLKYSKLGQPFFLRKEDTLCLTSISPMDWTSEELRRIADYMDNNPNCKLIKSDYE